MLLKVTVNTITLTLIHIFEKRWNIFYLVGEKNTKEQTEVHFVPIGIPIHVQCSSVEKFLFFAQVLV
jgi:hypothetical protein